MRQVKLVGALGAMGVSAAAFAGPDWVEQGDAGAGLTSAQVTSNTFGTLNSISGNLTGGRTPDYEDCYLIRIMNPANFSMQVGSANFNAQLFLFNISVTNGAFGLLANDDQSATNNMPRIGNMSNDGTNVIVSLPGLYMIGITGFNHDPVSQTGAIFNQATTTEISGPDGPGGFNPQTGWAGTGETGSYEIFLTGAGPATPAAGAVGVLGLAGVVGGRRRRRARHVIEM